jgi:nucleotidyltransferase substrate binding protein (TIGR01987 family)
MVIQILSLTKAAASLDKGLTRANQNLYDLEVRDACIQRFEYTYELGIKMMKRYIQEQNPVTENIDQMNFRDFLRLAAETGLIQDVNQWFLFQEARNKTSHAYDERLADEVFGVITAFSEEAQFLIQQLRQRLS